MKQTLVVLQNDPNTPDGNRAIFEAFFNDDLTIEPNAQLALHSCALNRGISEIIVDGINRGLEFTFDETADRAGAVAPATGLKRIALTEGVYTKTNILDLLAEMERLMNATLKHPTDAEVEAVAAGPNPAGPRTRDIGSQVKIGIGQNEFLNIGMKGLSLTAMMPTTPADSDTYPKTIVAANVLGSSSRITGAVGSGAVGNVAFTSHVRSQATFIKGCGVFQARIKKMFHNSAQSGFLIGLLENTAHHQAKLAAGSVTPANYTYAIRTNVSGNFADNYQFLVNDQTIQHGAYQDAGFAPRKTSNPVGQGAGGAGAQGPLSQNDIVSISLTDGNIELKVYQVQAALLGSANTQTEVRTILSTPYQYYNEVGISAGSQKSYIPIVTLFGETANTHLDRVIINLDPYDPEVQNVELSEPGFLDNEGVGNLTVPVPRPLRDNVQTIHNVIFDSETLANFLGFRNQQLNVALTEGGARNNPAAVVTFTADNSIKLILQTNTYLVELLNVPLNSFHSARQGRANILSPIPITEGNTNDDGRVQYEPNNLLYLNVNNENRLSLRNMRARVIADDFSEILIEGNAELNILIKEGC